MRHKKRGRWIIGVSVVLFGLGALYLLGKAILPSQGLEYRCWAELSGILLWLWVLPLFLLFFIFRLLFEKSAAGGGKRAAVCAALALAAGSFCVWGYFSGMGILFAIQEEVRVMPGLLAVNKGGFPGPSRWEYYEPEGLLFRRAAEVTPETRLAWLTDKYGGVFLPVEGGETNLFQDAERPEIQITVSLSGTEMRDDYIEQLTRYYLQRGYAELALSREVWTGEAEEWRLVLADLTELEAFCRDASALMEYVAAADEIFEDYRTNLKFSMKEYGSENVQNIAGLPFGKLGQWEELEPLYYLDLEALQPLVQEKCDVIRRRADSRKGDGEEAETTEDLEQTEVEGPAAEESAGGEIGADRTGAAAETSSASEPVLSESEIAEAAWPEQAEAARAVYEAFLEELGYQYEARCSAKGNFYVDLGQHPADNLQNAEQESRYMLTYDRESKNGKCYLFVLSETPAEEDTIADTRLREFYAVEKETGRAVAGEKTGWSQPGCAEYRELTGE